MSKGQQTALPHDMTMLHKLTGKSVSDYFCPLDLQAKYIFSIVWADEKELQTWFHLLHEYTEIWLHQQKIRDAVDRPGLLTREYFLLFLESVFRALPFTFNDVEANDGTYLRIRIDVAP